MSNNYDVEMTKDETLELDAIISKWDPKSQSTVSVNKGSKYNLNGIQKNTAIFNPKESGVYELNVNDQILKVNVVDQTPIPDSVVSQYTAESFDESNQKWVDQVGSYDLNGGSGTKKIDSNGNSVVEYDGSSGQGHTNTSINVSHDRVAVGVVFKFLTTGGNTIYRDPDDKVFFLEGNGNGYLCRYGGTSTFTGGSPDTNLHLAITYGPQFGSSDEEIEIDDKTVATGGNGSKGISGFTLAGKWSSTYSEFNGQILEVLIYENPTKSQINSERTRLKSKYSGLSF